MHTQLMQFTLKKEHWVCPQELENCYGSYDTLCIHFHTSLLNLLMLVQTSILFRSHYKDRFPAPNKQISPTVAEPDHCFLRQTLLATIALFNKSFL